MASGNLFPVGMSSIPKVSLDPAFDYFASIPDKVQSSYGAMGVPPTPPTGSSDYPMLQAQQAQLSMPQQQQAASQSSQMPQLQLPPIQFNMGNSYTPPPQTQQMPHLPPMPPMQAPPQPSAAPQQQGPALPSSFTGNSMTNGNYNVPVTYTGDYNQHNGQPSGGGGGGGTPQMQGNALTPEEIRAINAGIGDTENRSGHGMYDWNGAYQRPG